MSYCRRFIFLIALPLILAAQTPPQCRVELFIGDPEFSTGDGGPALNAKFAGLGSLAAADDGTIYLADYLNYRIRKIDPQGIVTTIAGNGTSGTAGDGGSAVQAQLSIPSSLTLAPDGSLYFVDDVGHLLRRITPTGTLETLYSQRAGSISGVLATADGLYFTETTPSSGGVSDIVRGVYCLESDGSKTALAGGMAGFGNGTDDGVPALEYTFEAPGDMLLDSNDELVVRDRNRIMRIGHDGIIRVIVGNGGGSFVDGAPVLETGLGFPNHLAANTAGDLLIADGTWGLLVVRDGVIHRISSGSVSGLTTSAAGVFFAQAGRVFRLLEDDTVQPIAGVDRTGWYEPGRPLNQSLIRGIRKMVIDSQDRLYYFGSSFATVVSRTTLDGKVEIVAGGGDQPAEDGVPVLDAALGFIGDIALGGQDRLYMSVGTRSGRPSMILRVELNDTLTVLAGEGELGQTERFYNQNIIDTNFQAQVPLIAVTPSGMLLFQIRGRAFQVDANGAMTAGPQGQPSFMAVDREGRLLSVDGDFEVYIDLLSAPLEPFSLIATQGASASNGTYFVLSGAIRVARRTPEGRTADLLASGSGFQFDNGKLGINAGLGPLSAISTNKDGDLFIADSSLDRVFVIRNANTCAMERPFSAAVINGASFDSTCGFAPGELVSVFGDFLGGDALAYGSPGQSSQGTWQTDVGDLEVFLDDQPAPIIFSRADQAAFIIPNEVSGVMDIRFRRNGLDSPMFSYPVKNAAPGLFTVNTSGGGQAAALNQDSSINSPSNAAAAGSVIVLYLTGAGTTDPPSVTGSLNEFPLPQLVEPVEVLINNIDAVVEFAGPAPSLVSGVVQVNARIPADMPSGPVPVSVTIGGVTSPASPTGQAVTISIQ